MTENQHVSAWTVLRRGIRETPEIRQGLGPTIAAALLSSAGQLVLPVVVQQAIDRGFSELPDGTTNVNIGLIAVIVAVAAATLIFVFFMDRLVLWRFLAAGESALSALRVKAFAHIHDLSIAEHSETKRGQLTARVTSDTETLSRFLQWGALTWVRQSAVVAGSLLAMFVFSWQLALVVVAVYLPLIPSLRYIQRRQFDAYSQVRTSVGDTIGLASESIGGAATIRGYRYQQEVSRRLLSSSRKLTNDQIGAHRFFAVLSPILAFFGALAVSASILVALWIGADQITIGRFGAFIFLLTIVNGPISQIAEVLDQTQTAMAGWAKIHRLLDTEIELVEPDNLDAAVLDLAPPTVEFRSVDFRYRTGDPVITDVSFVVPEGTSVAIVGETGSGKSTIAKLICRLADPTGGSVLVGGHDLRTISKSSRNRTIRMVAQDGFLFDTTVLENIRYGRPDATDDDIYAAAAKLGLVERLLSLPQGFETMVGERGDNVSVGERQLIALVRAQIAEAGLLILDEATSSVDPEIEQDLAEALDRLSQDRTTISIAHRMSTAERSDLILVLDRGQLVEQGTHNDLIKANNIYHDLYHALDSSEASTSAAEQ